MTRQSMRLFTLILTTLSLRCLSEPLHCFGPLNIEVPIRRFRSSTDLKLLWRHPRVKLRTQPLNRPSRGRSAEPAGVRVALRRRACCAAAAAARVWAAAGRGTGAAAPRLCGGASYQGCQASVARHQMGGHQPTRTGLPFRTRVSSPPPPPPSLLGCPVDVVPVGQRHAH